MKTLLLSLLLPLLLFAQDYDVRLTLTTDTVPLDESLVLTAWFQYPNGQAPRKEVLIQNLIERASFSQPPFKLLSHEVVEETPTSQTIKFQLKPQVTGRHPLSFFTIPFGQAPSYEILSPVVFVNVTANPFVSVGNAPLAPLMTFTTHYPFHPKMGGTRSILFPPSDRLVKEAQHLLEYKQIPWIELVAFFILAAFIYFLRNYTYQETPEQRQMRLRKVTLQRLEKLQTGKITDYDSAYAAISNVLRNYLEGQYGIAASKQTTREFIEEISHTSLFDSHLQQELKALLLRADAVKFAGYNASSQECAEAERITKRVIV